MYRMNRCHAADNKRTIPVYGCCDGGTQSGAVETRWFFVWNAPHTGWAFQENDSDKRLTSDIYITICATDLQYPAIMRKPPSHRLKL